MKKYAKIVNNETKEVSVGLGANVQFYQSVGMTEQEVEQAWNGAWYLAGFAPKEPEKSVEEQQSEVRSVRNRLLDETDKFMILDYPIEAEESELYKAYRKYLRDYTLLENWWLENPKTFEEWKQTITITASE